MLKVKVRVFFFFQIIISLVTFSLDFGLLCDK